MLDEISISAVEELTLQDLQSMAGIEANHQLPKVRDIRASHHAIARFIALGYKRQDISRITGYSTTTISQLRNSPAFQELLDHYQATVDEKVIEQAVLLRTRIDLAAEDSVERLHDHIKENPDLTPAFILETAKTLSDRAGCGPVQRSEQKVLHTVLTRSDIIALKDEVNGKELGIVERRHTLDASITGETIEVSAELVPQPIEASGDLRLCAPAEAEGEAALEEDAAEGLQSQGPSV